MDPEGVTTTHGINALAERIRERRDGTQAASVGPQRKPDGVYDVLTSCLECRKDGTLSCEDLAIHTSAITQAWNSIQPQLRAKKQPAYAIEWVIEPEYAKARKLAGLVLDLMGYLSAEDVRSPLREALTLSDPRLKLSAALSLLRLNETVDPAELESIAAGDQVRILLWDRLRELGMESLMPLRWAATEKLAASALSRWASSPSELGAPPEDIELMATYPLVINAENVSLYLFRFREYAKPWIAGEGWMAGIAGPYLNGRQMSSPWSDFERWDAMPPDQHVLSLFGRADQCLIADNQGAESGESADGVADIVAQVVPAKANGR